MGAGSSAPPLPDPAKQKERIPDEESSAVAHAKDLGWDLTREPDSPDQELDLTEQVPAITIEFYERLNARVLLLMSKEDRGPLGQPSWKERVLSCVYLRAQKIDRKRVSLELITLCEKSNAVFGDWKKDPPKKLVHDVGRAAR